MRTAIYLRISRDQTGEEAGVRRQEQDCRELVTELGWDLVEIYRDNDLSASSGKPRPSYERMLEAIQADQIDAIVAWHTDRLYRRLVDLEHLIKITEKHAVMIRAVRAGEVDLATPTGRMLARILGSVAFHEGEQKSDRWRRSYRQGREEGRWYAAGPRTFGYHDDGTIHLEESAAIRSAVDGIMSGRGAMAICRELDDNGFRTTRGNRWQTASLRKLLANPRLTGMATLNGDIVGTGEWEPILDRGTWEAVNAILSRGRRTGKGRQSVRSLLYGLALCATDVDGQRCGRRLVRTYGTIPIYTCRSGETHSGHGTISAARLEEIVEAFAMERFADDKVRQAVARRLAGVGTSAALLTREIDNLEGRLAELENELGDTSGRAASALARAIADVEDELRDRRERLGAVTPVTLPAAGHWPTEIELRAALIRLVVATVWIHPAPRIGQFDPERVRIDPIQT